MYLVCTICIFTHPHFANYVWCIVGEYNQYILLLSHCVRPPSLSASHRPPSLLFTIRTAWYDTSQVTTCTMGDEELLNNMWNVYERQRDLVQAFQDRFAVPEQCHIKFENPLRTTAVQTTGCEFYREMIYQQLRNIDIDSHLHSHLHHFDSHMLLLCVFTLCIYLYQFRLLNKILQELQQFNYNRREGGGSLWSCSRTVNKSALNQTNVLRRRFNGATVYIISRV